MNYDIKNLVRKIIDENSVFRRDQRDEKQNLIEKNYIVVKKSTADENIHDTVKRFISFNKNKLLESEHGFNSEIYDPDKFTQDDILITLVGKLQKFGSSIMAIRFNNQEIEDLEGEMYDYAAAKAKSTNDQAYSYMMQQVGELRGSNPITSQANANINYLQSLLSNQGNG